MRRAREGHGLRRTRASLALLGLLAMVACDSQGGPGELSARIEGPARVGAALVEIRGAGVTGFDGAGATRVFSSSPEAGVHRVVLVSPEVGELPFRIGVEDVKDEAVAATVISAVGDDDFPLASVTGFSVRVSR